MECFWYENPTPFSEKNELRLSMSEPASYLFFYLMLLMLLLYLQGGILLLIRNSGYESNRWFSALSLYSALWICCSLLLWESPEAFCIGGVFLLPAFYYRLNESSKRKTKKSLWRNRVFVVLLILGLIAGSVFTPLMLSGSRQVLMIAAHLFSFALAIAAIYVFRLLRPNPARFAKRILMGMQFPILICDNQLHILTVNESAQRLFSMSRFRLLGMHAARLFNDSHVLDDLTRKALSSGVRETVQAEIVSQGHCRGFVMISCYVLRNMYHDEQGVLFTVHDPSEEIRIEKDIGRFQHKCDKLNRECESLDASLSRLTRELSSYRENLLQEQEHNRDKLEYCKMSIAEKEALIGEIIQRPAINSELMLAIIRHQISVTSSPEEGLRLLTLLGHVRTLNMVHRYALESYGTDAVDFSAFIVHITGDAIASRRLQYLLTPRYETSSRYISSELAIPLSIIVNEVLTAVLSLLEVSTGLNQSNVSLLISFASGQNGIAFNLFLDDGNHWGMRDFPPLVFSESLLPEQLGGSISINQNEQINVKILVPNQ